MDKTVADLFVQFLDEDVIEDRREYSKEDLQLSEPDLTKIQVEDLYILVQQFFDPTEPKPRDIESVPLKTLQEYFWAFLHDEDGTGYWNDPEEQIIRELFTDIVRSYKPGSGNDNPPPEGVESVPLETLRAYFSSFLYDGTDGWSNVEVLTVHELFRDIVRYNSRSQPLYTIG